MAVSHAYVLFTNGMEKVLSTRLIENHHPKTTTDFVRNQKYKVWLHGDKGRNDILLNEFILLLEGK